MSHESSDIPTENRPISSTRFQEMIPLPDAESFTQVAHEALRWVTASGADDVVILLDPETAQLDELESSLSALGERVAVFHLLESGERRLPELQGFERFLLIYAAEYAVIFLVKPEPADAARSPYFGGWSLSRAEIAVLATKLLATMGAARPLPHTPGDHADSGLRFATQLSAAYGRVMAQFRAGASVNKDDLFSVLDILKAISSKRRAHDILYVFVEQIARIINVDRCSIVRVWGGERKGHVLASHEDERVHDLVISLDKYPELRLAMETRERVVIHDTARDPVTREFSDELGSAGIRGLLVIPIMLFDANVGSLLLRAARRRTGFTSREISFCEVVAEAASNALERAHLFEQIQRTNERLEFLAVTDGLTGLYNHRYFRKRLQEEFDRAARYGLSLSCLIFDVDNFKRINDTYGHLQGDSILREMAVRIIRTVRKSDIVARYGGEEFTVILPQTGAEGAKVEAERLHRELSTKPYQGMPEHQQVTVSIGLASYEHEVMLDSDALLRVADSALYEAKRLGKNRIVMGDGRGVEK